MKKSEYIPLGKQAKVRSVDDRWELLKFSPTSCVIECPFCSLEDKLEKVNHARYSCFKIKDIK